MRGAIVRRGVTMVEVLVALAVVASLMVLLVPAVQDTRSTSRSVQCQDHLRQLGIAMGHHEATAGEFPTNSDAYVKLLPYLEQPAAYEIAQRAGYSPLPLLAIFQCPSETYPPDPAHEQVPNYRINSGTRFPEPLGDGLNGFRVANRPVMVDGTVRRRGTRASEITDGLSNTAAFSERLVTRGGQNLLAEVAPETLAAERRRFPWTTTTTVTGPDAESRAVALCRESSSSPALSDGITPSVRNGTIGYDHLLPPNHLSCLNGEDVNAPEHFRYAIIPPSSLHAGGVNVLRGDGGVHFVGESIDLGVWRAVGTRQGGESIGTDPF